VYSLGVGVDSKIVRFNKILKYFVIGPNDPTCIDEVEVRYTIVKL
jgi:hypothetical protein